MQKLYHPGLNKINMVSRQQVLIKTLSSIHFLKVQVTNITLWFDAINFVSSLVTRSTHHSLIVQDYLSDQNCFRDSLTDSLRLPEGFHSVEVRTLKKLCKN